MALPRGAWEFIARQYILTVKNAHRAILASAEIAWNIFNVWFCCFGIIRLMKTVSTGKNQIKLRTAGMVVM
jgi:hypothetical protein